MHLNKSKVTRQQELLGVRGPSRGKVLRRHYSQGRNLWEMFVAFLEGMLSRCLLNTLGNFLSDGLEVEASLGLNPMKPAVKGFY
jgi:hypothetical protein